MFMNPELANASFTSSLNRSNHPRRTFICMMASNMVKELLLNRLWILRMKNLSLVPEDSDSGDASSCEEISRSVTNLRLRIR